MEQAKMAYSPLGRAFEKRKKMIEEQEKKTNRFYNRSK